MFFRTTRCLWDNFYEDCAGDEKISENTSARHMPELWQDRVSCEDTARLVSIAEKGLYRKV